MSVENALTSFAKSVIKQSRSNLTRKKKNASKNLYKSLDYDLNVNKNSFSLSFLMDDYGKFIDKGVKGSETSKKAPKSPFKYKNKRPPTKALDKWVVRRNIKVRDAKGKFIKRDGIKYIIANAIFKHGIETTDFFTKPFNNAFKKLPDDLVEAYALDVDNFLKFSLK